jgi:hypothetical protein
VRKIIAVCCENLTKQINAPCRSHGRMLSIKHCGSYQTLKFKRLTATWNTLHEIRKRKANWTGHILCRNCLLKQVIEGKIKGRIEVTRRRGRRRKQLLDDLGNRRGYSDLKEEALDRIKWRNRFGRGCGPVV